MCGPTRMTRVSAQNGRNDISTSKANLKLKTQTAPVNDSAQKLKSDNTHLKQLKFEVVYVVSEQDPTSMLRPPRPNNTSTNNTPRTNNIPTNLLLLHPFLCLELVGILRRRMEVPTFRSHNFVRLLEKKSHRAGAILDNP
ncbi:hypothetical protein PILCRDRAFT_701580 [Piloderma croceum F 1598]|uniref:Uncharacterized protein n=1 Tax=Piloderma croceum (strain F 1598) TaxID=765440 RepID=A0A0C3BB62_PILCF|nr:hypothetical protein PILCRDRAFT_701580 [Piloderma croceum F 1598]